MRCRIAWSLFQLWYASPLPYISWLRHLRRHRGARVSLELRAVPGVRGVSWLSCRRRATCLLVDWLLAAAGIGAVLYLVVFYRDIAMRPGLPTQGDILAAVVGVVLLEASRRAEGRGCRSSPSSRCSMCSSVLICPACWRIAAPRCRARPRF